jgi:hypothetical protein
MRMKLPACLKILVIKGYTKRDCPLSMLNAHEQAVNVWRRMLFINQLPPFQSYPPSKDA